MLDPGVVLALVPLVPSGSEPHNGPAVLQQDEQRAKQLLPPWTRLIYLEFRARQDSLQALERLVLIHSP